MRFMMIVKATPQSEQGGPPSEEMLACMGRYNEELMKAGVLLDLGGLRPSSSGVRIKFDGDKKTVVDGPFTEAKELVGGYWIIQVRSREEALEWAMRVPNPAAEGPHALGEVELRQFYELEDFGNTPAVENAKKLGEELTADRKYGR